MEGRGKGRKAEEGRQVLILHACCLSLCSEACQQYPPLPLPAAPARRTSQGFYAGAHRRPCSMALPFAQWGDVFLAEQHTALPEGLRTYCLAGGPRSDALTVVSMVTGNIHHEGPLCQCKSMVTCSKGCNQLTKYLGLNR
jgi:hypothetical protein